MSYDHKELTALVDELRNLGSEQEWIEFKKDNFQPDVIGQAISALSNAAALHGKDKAYLVYGIKDDTHEVIGTIFDLAKERVGAEELENWLNKMLDPKINFICHEFEYVPGTKVVVIEIDAASSYPVSFKKACYIRVGSYTKPISAHRGKEKALWSKLEKKTFELELAKTNLSNDEVLTLLDYNEAFKKLGIRLPDDKSSIIEKLIENELVTKSKGRLAITNLGAVLFAVDLTKFDGLARRAVRVVKYDGKDKLETEREFRGKKGYALGVDNIVSLIATITPAEEVMEGASLIKKFAYPQRAVRELVANALIHQDFSIGGAGPMIEIFDNRVEISNPGTPLVDVQRIIDHSPRSRNEKLAGTMARMGICEERGSGVDKVVIECEMSQLPAPEFIVEDDFTRTKLFAYRTLRDMTREDKIRATYYHAVIKYITDGYMENNTLRERFGIAKENYPTASNIIRLALDAGAIKTRDSDTATKYVPFWA